MKKTLELLTNINMIDLENAKKGNISPSLQKQLNTLLTQLNADFNNIASGYDPILLAENLLANLSAVAENMSVNEFANTFSQNLLDKLLYIYDILPPEISMGQTGVFINELYQGIDTLKKGERGEHNKKLGINEYMKDILFALESGNTSKAIEGFNELSIFMQNNFPNQQWPEIQKYLRKNFKIFVEKNLPPLEIVGALNESLAYEDFLEENNVKDTMARDNILRGITIFSELMGLERVGAALEHLNLSEEVITNTERLIHKNLPSSVEARKKTEAKATQLIQTITDDCVKCEIYLQKIISQEAKHLPNNASQYNKVEHNHIKLGEIDVDTLTHDLLNKKGGFAKGGPYDVPISRELKHAAKSYQGLRKLHNILDSSQSAVKKINRLQQEYKTKNVQEAFKSNPDPRVKTFFKNVGYYLANFLTAGLVHVLTKGSPIMSEPQKFAKRTKKVLQHAKREQLINVRNKKR